MTWLSGLEDIFYDVPVNQTLNIIEGSTLSIYDYENKPKIYYNNPIDESFVVNSSQGIESYRIFDGIGKEILTGTPNQNNIAIDMSSLNSGIYFCELKLEGSINKTFKLIKK